MPAELVVALFAGALLGGSAHRAGLCTVKAVAEVMTTGRGHILGSFVKASLWTAGVLALLGVFGAPPALAVWPLGRIAPLGGLVFGVGARLNGACSFSTLSRLAEGHLVMVFTLAGWLVGLGVVARALPGLHVPAAPRHLPWVVILPLAAWMGWETRRVFQRLRGGAWPLHRARHWPLSVAVFPVALSFIALVAVGRPWSFTSSAICLADAGPLGACVSPGTLWAVSAAAFGAMALSARLRGSARARPIRPRAAARHLGAGTIMGLGAGLIPGGNDGLVLFGLPATSPTALPAWLSIVAGNFAALWTMRRVGGRVPEIRCTADICRADLYRARHVGHRQGSKQRTNTMTGKPTSP